jgi:hypothetical protein
LPNTVTARLTSPACTAPIAKTPGTPVSSGCSLTPGMRAVPSEPRRVSRRPFCLSQAAMA